MAKNTAALLPYGTTSSAPAITLPDTDLFKSERGSLTKNYFDAAIESLNKEYNSLKQLAEINQMAYGAAYNFVPRVGQTYYLYRTSDQQYLLSMIQDWNKYEFVVALEYSADSVWKPLSLSL